MRILLLIAVVGILMYSFGSDYVYRAIENGSVAALLVSGVHKDELEQTIVEYYKNNILKDIEALKDEREYEVRFTYTNVNQDDQRDVIAHIVSDATCGGGGCITTIYLQNDMREFEPIEFKYAAHSVVVLDSITGGMHDLRINGDTKSRMAWDGRQYVLESI